MNVNVNYILIFFLICISIILNLNIDIKLKCYFLIISLILCYYKPILLIPYSSSIFCLFLINKYVLKSKNLEGFEDLTQKDVYEKFVIILNNPTRDNINKIKPSNGKILNENSFFNIINDTKLIEYIENKSDDSIFLQNRLKFIKELLNCYFFTKTDFNLILNLSSRFRNFDELFKEFGFNINLQIQDVDKDVYRNNIEGFKDNTYKKLGIFFYKNNNLKTYLLDTIYQMGLYGIINDQYLLQEKLGSNGFKKDVFNKYNKLYNDYIVDYNKLKKYIYELVILFFFYPKIKIIEKKENYDFNQKITDLDTFKEYLNLYNKIDDNKGIIDQLIIYNKGDIRKNKKNINEIYKRLKYLYDFKFFINYNISYNNGLISDVKLITKELFPKNLFKLNNLFSKKKSLDGLTNTTILENVVKNQYNVIKNNFNSMKLLNIKFYSFKNKEEKKINKYKIFNNLILFYYILDDTFIDFLIKVMKDKNKKNIYLKLYQKYEPILKLQIANEKKLEQILYFTDKDDIFFDNLFYYTNLKFVSEKLNSKKILPIEIKKIEPPKKEASNSEDDPFSELLQSQKNFQLDLDNYLTENQKKARQEDAILSYYQFLNKEKYTKLETLNKLAEERNKSLKMKEENFYNIVDNFGNKIFEIIDEIIALYEKHKKKYFDSLKGKKPENSIMTFIDFLKDVFEILTKSDKILYSGVIVVIIAVFVFFIDNEEYRSEGVPNLFDILKL